MRWLLRGFLGLLALLVLALTVLWWRIDEVAGRAIEEGGTYALGVPTRVGGVGLRFLPPAFSIGGLRVANPAGYEGDFFALGRGRVNVETATLTQTPLVVPELVLGDIEIQLERRLRESNYDAILRNLRRFESGQAEPPAESQAGETPVVIRELRIEDVRATVRLRANAAAAVEQTVSVPLIRLRNVGEKGGGVDTAELWSMVLTAILNAVAKGAALPGGIGGELQAGLQRLDRVPYEVGGTVQSEVQKLVGDSGLGEAVSEEAGEAAGKLAEEAVKGLGGLLGRKDKEGEASD